MANIVLINSIQILILTICIICVCRFANLSQHYKSIKNASISYVLMIYTIGLWAARWDISWLLRYGPFGPGNIRYLAISSFLFIALLFNFRISIRTIIIIVTISHGILAITGLLLTAII